MRQSQCPKCGYFKITDLHRKFEWMLILPLSILTIVLFVVVHIPFTDNPILYCGGVFIFIMIIGKILLDPFKNSYECNNCGYQWKEPK